MAAARPHLTPHYILAQMFHCTVQLCFHHISCLKWFQYKYDFVCTYVSLCFHTGYTTRLPRAIEHMLVHAKKLGIYIIIQKKN
jgi:hypothetical protein